MTDNEIKRERTFDEEIQYFKQQIKEVFDNYHNPNGSEDRFEICVLRDAYRTVLKAEEEITRQQADIERLKKELNDISKRTLKLLEKKIKDVKVTLGQTWEIQNALKDTLKEMVGENNG